MSRIFKSENSTAKKISENSVVEIRQMEKTDAAAVFRIAENCDLSFWSEVDYQNETERNDGFRAVAEISGEPIGFIIARLITLRYYDLYFSDEFKNQTQIRHKKADSKLCSELNLELESVVEAEIYNVAVLRQWRRNGAGESLLSALFEFVANFCAVGQTASVWLEVRKSNAAAIEFYSANGFEIVYTRKNFYRNPTEDALTLKALIETIETAAR